MGDMQLTINLPGDVFKEIEKYKKNTHRKTTEAAITELIKYALALPLYFKDYDWSNAETEADKEIETGNTKSFDTVEDLITDLNK